MSNSSNPYIRRIVLKQDEIESYSEYPFHLPVLQKLHELDLHPNVTIFMGENGMGKSTLLEAIAIASGFNPEGGTLNFSFSTFYSHSILERYIKVIKGANRPKDGFFLRAETFYNVASKIEELDREPLGGKRIIDSYGGLSLHAQSHVESFFSLFSNRFGGNGLYILDEPEAALSPLRQLSMLCRLQELVNKDSQFIIATHSPILMAYPGAKLIELTKEGLHETVLEDTGHYQIMKQFFHDKERMLHHLLHEEE
ncbi:AAA family ATPase [Falsibacillus albus]|uniref:AAA family ATPase n=1 Tax=Falsibacillus albus TaxID=2478915 RepID=A0A3L7JVU2_9BACI|nr:AAA family ATPase [Falsibacillus albus]